MQKRALLTGISGMDGSHLADLLLEKGYAVYGIVRRSSAPNFERIAHIQDRLHLISADLHDLTSLISAFKESRPEEIYNMAAQSFAVTSWNQPILTGDITGLGVTRMLDAMREVCPDAHFYQASSAEIFGNTSTSQNENTAIHPRSPYAVAKAYGHWITVNYRESYNLHATSGILQNHESERRSIEFVTRKVTDGAARIKLGMTNELRLGNLDASRDWGYAPDFCINSDVPILTTDGWKFRDEIEVGQEIINFDPAYGHITRDTVLKKIELESDGDKIVFEGRGVFIRVTPNHRMVYQKKSRTSKGGWSDWKISSAKELFDILNNLALQTKYEYRLPHFQDYDAPDFKGITDEQIYLIGALLAEGCLNNSHGAGRGSVVSISQSRIANLNTYTKIQNAINILGLSYTLRERNDGVAEWSFDTVSSSEIIEWFDQPNVHVMPSYCYALSARQAEILFVSLMDCDGSWGSFSYASKRRLLAVDFQTIAHLAGYRTSSIKKSKMRDDCYHVYVVSRRKKHSYIQSVREENNGDKDVWCVQTKNGTIVTRDNDCIVISGNCSAIHSMLQQDCADDYVIGTGVVHSIRDLVRVAFETLDLNWQDYVVQDDKFMRPLELETRVGDFSKAKRVLGWTPTTSFETMIEKMVENDYNLLKAQL